MPYILGVMGMMPTSMAYEMKFFLDHLARFPHAPSG